MNNCPSLAHHWPITGPSLAHQHIAGSEAAGVVEILDTTSVTSLSQMLQAALDAGDASSGLSLSVRAVLVEGGTRTAVGRE